MTDVVAEDAFVYNHWHFIEKIKKPNYQFKTAWHWS